MNTRTANNYTAEKVIGFLESVKVEIEKGKNSTRTFQEICKFYKFGQITLPALKKCGFVKTDGRGFENWKWVSELGIGYQDVIKFVDQINRLKILIPKRDEIAEIDQDLKNRTVVQFKPIEHKKAVQAELPIHPIRLKLLNEIRVELNEIRLRLERIEDAIDQETTKKAAGK